MEDRIERKNKKSLSMKDSLGSACLRFNLMFIFHCGIQIIIGDSDSGFNNAEQILKEDYLRLSVRDNAADPNSERAAWRFYSARWRREWTSGIA